MTAPRLAVPFLILLLGGCAASVGYQGDAGHPVPASLEVLKPIPTEPGWARAFLQHGEVVRYGDFSRYHPFCYLEVTLVQDKSQTISPGRFAVTGVSRRLEEVVHNDNLRYAARWLVDSDVSDQTQLLIFDLESADQPGVRSLVCGGGFDAPSRAAAPTPAQVTETLGGYARLQ